MHEFYFITIKSLFCAISIFHSEINYLEFHLILDKYSNLVGFGEVVGNSRMDCTFGNADLGTPAVYLLVSYCFL